MDPQVVVSVSNMSREVVAPNTGGVIRIRFELAFQLRPRNNGPLLDLLVELDAALARVFEQIFANEHVQGNDRVGIRIEFEGDAQPFFKMVRFSNNPVRQLFDAISRLLQSNRELLMTKWSVEMQIVRCPRGAGSTKRAWSHASAAKKKFIVMIRNEDNLCLWRALVVAFAHAQYHDIVASQVPAAVARKRFTQVSRANSTIQFKVLLLWSLDCVLSRFTFVPNVAPGRFAMS